MDTMLDLRLLLLDPLADPVSFSWDEKEEFISSQLSRLKLLQKLCRGLRLSLGVTLFSVKPSLSKLSRISASRSAMIIWKWFISPIKINLSSKMYCLTTDPDAWHSETVRVEISRRGWFFSLRLSDSGSGLGLPSLPSPLFLFHSSPLHYNSLAHNYQKMGMPSRTNLKGFIRQYSLEKSVESE